MRRILTISACCVVLAQAALYFQLSSDSTKLMIMSRDGNTILTVYGDDSTNAFHHNDANDTTSDLFARAGYFGQSPHSVGDLISAGTKLDQSNSMHLTVRTDSTKSDLTVQGNITGDTIFGHVIGSTGSFITEKFGDTMYVRASGRLTLPYRFATVYDSTTTDADTIDIVNYNFVGQRVRIMNLSAVGGTTGDDVVIVDGLTTVATLTGRLKYVELDRSVDGTWRVWESN